jgi:hypothetical protein
VDGRAVSLLHFVELVLRIGEGRGRRGWQL